MAGRVISMQEEWHVVRDRFPRACHDQAFIREFSFDPTSVVRLLGRSVRDALPNASTTGSRWAIFERAITDGATVEKVNRRAREVSSPVEHAFARSRHFLRALRRVRCPRSRHGDEARSRGRPAPDQLSAITEETVREATAEFDRLGRHALVLGHVSPIEFEPKAQVGMLAAEATCPSKRERIRS